MKKLNWARTIAFALVIAAAFTGCKKHGSLHFKVNNCVGLLLSQQNDAGVVLKGNGRGSV